jgi:2-polyprenyl-3-methyl-5-hydroxy-6-metoxy-1,4-benzoquinol methylase
MQPTELKWTPELVKRYWEFQRPETYFGYHRGASIAAFASKYIKKGANVLDYGCGPGFLIPHLIKKGYNVTGVDDMIYPFPSIDNIMTYNIRFDAILLIELIEHLYVDDFVTTLANIHSLLSHDGTLIITTPNNEKLEDNLIYYPPDNVVFHRWQHVRSWNKNTLRSALEKQFIVKEIIEMNFLGPRAMKNCITRFVAHTVNKFKPPQSLVAIATKRK